MKDDPFWIDVTELMKAGYSGLGKLTAKLNGAGHSVERLARLLGITEIDLHAEELTGEDKNLDVVVDIFNRINSAGTKLSQGDLALANICARWPQGRAAMKAELKRWESERYNFSLDWLLRSVNTILTGRAKFEFLHGKSAEEVREALARAARHIDSCLNMISGRLGLDHDQVLFARFAIPVMARYLDWRREKKLGAMDQNESDKLLFWFVQCGMWGRFSASVETTIDQDLAALEGPNGGLDELLEQLRLWHGGLRAEPDHFTGWSQGARFYPVLYLLTRMGDARDWGKGWALKASMLGKMNRIEVHHIFPKAQLYKRGFKRPEVNALANYCFQTKETNLEISDRLPEEYFPIFEARYPGGLKSQWIPGDPKLWKIENFRAFIEERKRLLADELNCRMEELLHGDLRWLAGPTAPVAVPTVLPARLSSEDEEQEIERLNAWMREQGLQPGVVAYDFANADSGRQQSVFDLAWPDGIQQEFSQPVAVLLNEPPEVLAVASQAGYRCFTSPDDFKRYVASEIIGSAAAS